MSVNIFKNGILSKIAGAVGDAVPLINNFLTNQEGKGAADANTVYVLNNKIEELNSSLGGLRFGTDGEGNYGYFGADDSLIPFKSGCSLLDFQSRYGGSNVFTFETSSTQNKVVVCAFGGAYNVEPTITTTKGTVTQEVNKTEYPNKDGHGYVPLVKICTIENCSSATITVTINTTQSKHMAVFG